MIRSGLKLKNSIFMRLIITFLIITIPLYILGISIYRWGIQTVRSELLNSMSSQVSFYLNSMDNEIQRIKALQYDLVNDEDLNKLAHRAQLMYEFERFDSMLRLQNRLKAIKNSSMYIDEVSVHIPSLGKTISAVKGVDAIYNDKLLALNKYDNSSESQILYLNNKLYLSSLFPLPIYTSKDTLFFLIEIELSTGQLAKALGQFADNEGSGALLLNPSKNFIVANARDEAALKQIQNKIQYDAENAKDGKSTLTVGKSKYLVIHAKSDYLNMMLYRYTPEDRIFDELEKYQFWFWLFTIASIAVIIVFSFYSHKLIHKPLNDIINAFDKLKRGDLNSTVYHHGNDEFGYIYVSFNEMVEKLSTLIDQVYKQKILSQRAELKQLQAQINPHFLYNSFFILHRMIKLDDKENSIRFSQQLGNYFKFITRSAADEVTLAKETEHAKTYSDIQALRYSKRMIVEFGEIPDSYKNIMVPRLILQPVIENAIEHGLKDKEKDGIVKVIFEEKTGGLRITIQDNGEDMDDQEIERLRELLLDSGSEIECTGIINIHRRIQLKFGSNCGLSVSRSELGGLKVDIDIIQKD